MKKTSVGIEFKGLLSFLILHELSLKELSGEDLAIKIGKRKGNQLTPGTIYPTLKKLRKMKLLKFKRFGRRKVYHLTDEGKAELTRMYGVVGEYFKGLLPYLRGKKPKKVKKKGVRKASRKT